MRWRNVLILLMLMLFIAGMGIMLYPIIQGAMVDHQISMNAQAFLEDKDTQTQSHAIIIPDSTESTEPELTLPAQYDGFNQWCKQVAAICLTAFMQTTLLFLGMMSFQTNMLLGLGIMLAANEVPRIAQQFGLDSSVRVNMMSVFHTTSTAVNLTRALTKAK